MNEGPASWPAGLTAPGAVHACDHRIGNCERVGVSKGDQGILASQFEENWANPIGCSAHHRPTRSDAADHRQHRYVAMRCQRLSCLATAGGDIEDTAWQQAVNQLREPQRA